VIAHDAGGHAGAYRHAETHAYPRKAEIQHFNDFGTRPSACIGFRVGTQSGRRNAGGYPMSAKSSRGSGIRMFNHGSVVQPALGSAEHFPSLVRRHSCRKQTHPSWRRHEVRGVSQASFLGTLSQSTWASGTATLGSSFACPCERLGGIGVAG